MTEDFIRIILFGYLSNKIVVDVISLKHLEDLVSNKLYIPRDHFAIQQHRILMNLRRYKAELDKFIRIKG